MTAFEIPATDWRFPVTMVMVCVPFMVLISLLQTRTFTKCVDKITAGGKWILSIPGWLLKKITESSDPRVAEKKPPRRGRKRRLVVDADGGREELWWKWRPSWPLGAKKAVILEDVDLGKMERG